VASLIGRLPIQDIGENTFTGPSGNFCFPETYPGIYYHREEDAVSGLSSREVELPGQDSDGDEARKILGKLFQQFINLVHQFVDRDCSK